MRFCKRRLSRAEPSLEYLEGKPMDLSWINDNAYLITFSLLLVFFVSVAVKSSEKGLQKTLDNFRMLSSNKLLDEDTGLKTLYLDAISSQLNNTLYIMICFLGFITFFTGVIAFQSVFG